MPGRSADRELGTRTSTATRASSATGTFIRKIQPHQKLVRSHPPMIGPRGRPTKLAAPQMPTARGRSASLNSTVRSESTVTMSAAPASPSTTRAARNASGEGAYAQPNEPAAKRIRAPTSSPLRPYLSPISPAGSMPATSARV